MAKKTKESLKKVSEGLKGLAQEGLRVGRKVAYEVAGAIEKTVTDGEYSHKAKRAGQAVAGVSREITKIVDQKYQEFQEEFYTPLGRFNYDRAMEVIADKGKAIGRYGEKAVQGLQELVEKGIQNVKADYREFVPTKEERDTKYEGIGTNYQGILFRNQFEKCLNFYERARKSIPGGLKLRGEILEDVKNYAIGTKTDLVKHYKKYQRQKEHEKADAVNKYL